MPRPRKPTSPLRCFNSSSEAIRLAVLLWVKHPLSLRNVEDLLLERGIDTSHENGALSMEPVRSDVRRHLPAAE